MAVIGILYIQAAAVTVNDVEPAHIRQLVSLCHADAVFAVCIGSVDISALTVIVAPIYKPIHLAAICRRIAAGHAAVCDLRQIRRAAFGIVRTVCPAAQHALLAAFGVDLGHKIFSRVVHIHHGIGGTFVHGCIAAHIDTMQWCALLPLRCRRSACGGLFCRGGHGLLRVGGTCAGREQCGSQQCAKKFQLFHKTKLLSLLCWPQYSLPMFPACDIKRAV